MGYKCTKDGPCSYCSSVARGGWRKHIKEEEEEKEKEKKTTEHKDNISARFYPGIDNQKIIQMKTSN